MQDAFSAIDLADGTELAGYVIESPLSAGAMGAVYLMVQAASLGADIEDAGVAGVIDPQRRLSQLL